MNHKNIYKSKTGIPVFYKHTKKTEKLGFYQNFYLVDKYIYRIETKKHITELLNLYKSLSLGIIDNVKDGYFALLDIDEIQEVFNFFYKLHQQTNLYIFNLEYSKYFIDENGYLIVYVEADLCRKDKEDYLSMSSYFSKQNSISLLNLYLEKVKVNNEKFINEFNELKSIISNIDKNQKNEDKIVYMKKRNIDFNDLIKSLEQKNESNEQYNEQYLSFLEKNIIHKNNKVNNHVLKVNNLFKLLNNIKTYDKEKLNVLNSMMQKEDERVKNLFEFIYKNKEFIELADFVLNKYKEKELSMFVEEKKPSKWSLKSFLKSFLKRDEDNQETNNLYETTCNDIMSWKTNLENVFEQKNNINIQSKTILFNKLDELIKKTLLYIREDFNIFNLSLVYYISNIINIIIQESRVIDTENLNDDISKTITDKIIEKTNYIELINTEYKLFSSFFNTKLENNEEKENKNKLLNFEKRIKEL